MPIGPTELIVALVIVLFVFGAGKLPQVGRDLGKGIRELRDGFEEDSPSRPKGPSRGDEDE